jgi:hypothetical protein
LPQIGERCARMAEPFVMQPSRDDRDPVRLHLEFADFDVLNTRDFLSANRFHGRCSRRLCGASQAGRSYISTGS